MAWTLIQHDESDSSHEFPRLSTGDYWEVQNIPDTYDHLKVVGFVQLATGQSSSMNLCEVLFNNDDSDDYSDQYMYYTTGTSVGGSYDANRAGGARMAYCADDQNAGGFSSFTLTIPNYCHGSVMHRRFLCRSGMAGGSMSDYYHHNMMTTGTWHSTAEIDRIKITEGWGHDSGFQQYSTMSLYGISVS
ncbi:uncharacterized protein METZ01_LOCUS453012 [marine metagenome]|uniref:Uncharacterized protein n=1 Tax=marine metagenome TaxID=408172 RepID=A0A382ZZQ6_9ZZZZ